MASGTSSVYIYMVTIFGMAALTRSPCDTALEECGMTIRVSMMCDVYASKERQYQQGI